MVYAGEKTGRSDKNEENHPHFRAGPGTSPADGLRGGAAAVGERAARPGTEGVSASAAPEARYVYEEVELPEDIIMSHAVELADGSLRFISSYSYVRENEDGSTAFVSQSSLWSLSASGRGRAARRFERRHEPRRDFPASCSRRTEAFSAPCTSLTRKSTCFASAPTARRPDAGPYPA